MSAPPATSPEPWACPTRSASVRHSHRESPSNRGRASAALSGAHTGHLCPARRQSSDHPVKPRGALAERFTRMPHARITARSTPATGWVTTARATARQRAERDPTCSTCAGEPRSTPRRACFTTCPKATLVSAASEVKLYLAVPSPRSSRCPPARPITSPSSVLRPVSFRARHRTALRSGLRSETSSIIGLAQGRVPNTGLRWPGPSFGTSDAHRDGRPQVPR